MNPSSYDYVSIYRAVDLLNEGLISKEAADTVKKHYNSRLNFIQYDIVPDDVEPRFVLKIGRRNNEINRLGTSVFA